jgi:hypothetical protein
MTEWRRVPSDTLCGGCAQRITEGAPALFRKLPNVKRERVRGECCAGDAPPDLPPLVERTAPIQPSFIKAVDVLQTRTRGSVRKIATTSERREWMPYSERE